MRVLRIHTEVEEIFLCEAHVLHQLPGRMLEAWWHRSTFVCGDAFDGFFEADVRLVPIKDPRQLRCVEDQLILSSSPLSASNVRLIAAHPWSIMPSTRSARSSGSRSAIQTIATA